jgi:phosphoribosylformylglycinamidine cyclo-ligase
VISKDNSTYAQAGVDIDAADNAKKLIKQHTHSTFGPEVLTDIGMFGGMFEFRGGRQSVLVSSADGVGTKIKIASLLDKHDTVGVDLVNHCVNDILACGAAPLFFLDYIAFSKVKEEILVDVVSGINKGCIESGCSLIGGETAQMPGMYRDGDYDIAGFCVGVAERGKIINGDRIRQGDKLIGIASSGLHSNGYSLVRKVLGGAELKRMSAELLKPTRIYVKPVLELLRQYGQAVHGISLITGGAFYDKISRILPANIRVRIDMTSWIIGEAVKGNKKVEIA